jgi:hypothetical protein
MNTPYAPPVDQLLKLGRPETEDPWLDYVSMGLSRADVPELIRLMKDNDLLADLTEDPPDDVDLPEWYANIHAWRALGQLKAEEAIPAILDIFYQIDEEDNDWLDGDVKEIFGQIGPAAIQPLGAYLLERKHGIYARGCTSDALARIAQIYPETRAECVDFIVRALENYEKQDESFNAFLIWDLTELKAVEHIDLIEKAFAGDYVDEMVAGDCEDIKIELGLLGERITPARKYDFFKRVFRDDDTPLLPVTIVPKKQVSVKKEKNKRKQEKKSRKKNRKK